MGALHIQIASHFGVFTPLPHVVVADCIRRRCQGDISVGLVSFFLEALRIDQKRLQHVVLP